MKECDKQNSHISSKMHMIYVFSNNDRHPVTKIFTPLHFFPFNLHQTTLYYPLIWLNPISISYRSISPHIRNYTFKVNTNPMPTM